MWVALYFFNFLNPKEIKIAMARSGIVGSKRSNGLLMSTRNLDKEQLSRS